MAKGNIIGKTNIPASTGSKASFPTFTTTEPIVLDKDINITLSQDDLKDILKNKYPVIIIKGYEENNELVFVQTEYVGGESMIEIKYILNDFNQFSDSHFNVLLLIDKYADTEEIYLNPYFIDTIVNTNIEQDIHARKRWINESNENRYTEITSGGITLHNDEDSRLHISAYVGENDIIGGFNVGGKYYDANQELQPIYYDVNFPTAKELPYLGYADYTPRTLALEETIPLSAVIVNPITNLNGFILSEFSYEETTLGVYPCYILSRNGAKVDIASAKLYMQRMTGTRFLPTYNYKNPRNTLFITAAGEFLKPQYDETNGLVLFKIPNPFALTTNLKTINNESIIGSGNISAGGTKLYRHDIRFVLKDDDSTEELDYEFIVITNNAEEYSWVFDENTQEDFTQIINIRDAIQFRFIDENNSDYSLIVGDFGMSYNITQDEYGGNLYSLYINTSDGDSWTIFENTPDDRHYYGSHILDTVTLL